MLRENFDKAVSWVQERIPADLARAVSANDLTSAFDALSALPARASATFLIPDLFPGVLLETLYVHDVGKHSSDAGVSDKRVCSTPHAKRVKLLSSRHRLIVIGKRNHVPLADDPAPQLSQARRR